MDFETDKTSGLFDNNFWAIVIGLIALEFWSFVAYAQIALMPVMFFLIAAIILTVALKNLKWGLYLVISELIIGGQGYLFFWPIGGIKISWRLGIFLLVFLIWLWRIIKERDFYWLKNKYLLALIPFGFLAVLGVVKAITMQTPLKDVFLDANAFLYFGLIGAFISTKISFRDMAKIIMAANLVLALKTVLTLFIFARGFSDIGHYLFYDWIRNTTLGEIALIDWPLYRIFFQSHFYLLVSFFIILGLLFFNKWKKSECCWLFIIAWFDILGLLISQSRSFWLVGVMTLVFFIILAIFKFKFKWQKIIWLVIITPVFVISGHLAVNFLIGDFNINLFFSRLSGGTAQVGVSSRQAQITPALSAIKKAPLWGQGWGKKITYLSADPRIKNDQNPTGTYSTYALELGYLDLILKIGLLGLTAYGLFLLLLAKSWLKLILDKKQQIGWLLGLVTLIISHFFTPYLNHPLGIGYLLLLVSLAENKS